MSELTERIQALGKRVSKLTVKDRKKLDCEMRELTRINELVNPSKRPPKKKNTTKGILKDIRTSVREIAQNTKPVMIDLAKVNKL